MISTIILLLIILPKHIITLACYTSIFAFGDSLTDVGNRILINHDPKTRRNANPPYGETFFHHPTGRFSDGRLIIDFIAEYYGLPFMPPSASVIMNNNGSSNIEGGVNFAVAGAATIDSAFYEERGIVNTHTNASLRVQMRWFNQLLPFFCATPLECTEKLKSSLFVLGPFGSNDYRHGLKCNKDIEEIKSYVPIVIDVISATINDLIELGAKTIMVPGIGPDGCIATILTTYGTDNKEDYDSDGCLIWMNELAEHHNQHLLHRLNTIRHHNPDIVIIYADFYNASMLLYNDPEKYGFLPTLEACCGIGGKYNYNGDVICGDKPVKSPTREK